MPNFSAPRSRGVVVLAAAAVLAVSAGSGAVAGSMITGKDIKDRSIEARDLDRGSVTSAKVKNRTLKLKDLSSEVTDELGAKGPAGPKGEKGDTGPQGPAGPAGGSRTTFVENLNGLWTARADDVAGIRMTGDGVMAGPFASPGTCTTAGVDYARLDFSGMNGQPLKNLDNLVYYARYLSDTDTLGVGSPSMRVILARPGGGEDRLTFTPNTQFGKSTNYDIGEGEFHEWVVTSGTARFNNDAGGSEPDETWSALVSQYGERPIANISILFGCGAGTNWSSLLRWAEVNGQTYKFGS